MQLKTFSAHNRSENSHDVRRKRFNTHAETGRPRLFHVQNKPRRGWCLWRFAALIPSGCRLTPIHKVMGDHAPRGTTPAWASPPHGLSTIVHSRWLFQVGIPGVRHSRIPLHMAFPECSFQIVIPDELSRWLFHDTCFHVLNF